MRSRRVYYGPFVKIKWIKERIRQCCDNKMHDTWDYCPLCGAPSCDFNSPEERPYIADLEDWTNYDEEPSGFESICARETVRGNSSKNLDANSSGYTQIDPNASLADFDSFREEMGPILDKIEGVKSYVFMNGIIISTQ